MKIYKNVCRLYVLCSLLSILNVIFLTLFILIHVNLFQSFKLYLMCHVPKTLKLPLNILNYFSTCLFIRSATVDIFIHLLMHMYMFVSDYIYVCVSHIYETFVYVCVYMSHIYMRHLLKKIQGTLHIGQ